MKNEILKSAIMTIINEIRSPKWGNDCICDTVNTSNNLSHNEYYEMNNFLRENLPPKKYTYEGGSHLIYCWPEGEKESRIEWLEEQLNDL